MTVYVILFRGVGGATQLPVKPLREKLTEAGLQNVATYINSGNAVVKSQKSREKIVSIIAEVCAKEFGFKKAIHALTAKEWHTLIENNPFPKAVDVPKFLHAAALEAEPEEKNIAALRKYAIEGERIEIVDKVAYLHTPHGFGVSKFAARFDKDIGVANTARNWRTVMALRDLAEKAGS